MRVLHVITGLFTGGAEAMLYKLLAANPPGARSEVVSLREPGPMACRIQALGVPVRSLRMSPGRAGPASVACLARWMRETRPQVVQTWMYHADLLGGLAGLLAGRPPLVWGIRHNELDAASTKPGTLWTARACARASGLLPRRIVCCSQASRQSHIRLGYAPEGMVVIPNGFDLDAFHPDPSARLRVRQELDIPPQAPLIGLVARFHPQKDLTNFVEAAGRLHRVRPDCHFLLCGEGLSPDNRALSGWIEDAGIKGRCRLLGRRDDVARLMTALDVATSASYSEGFPNAVGEAMACGVPCVATAAGDSAHLVGSAGHVVPPRDPQALAAGWESVLSLPPDRRGAMGEAGRQRIAGLFSLPAVAARYHALYEEVCAECAG